MGVHNFNRFFLTVFLSCAVQKTTSTYGSNSYYGYSPRPTFGNVIHTKNSYNGNKNLEGHPYRQEYEIKGTYGNGGSPYEPPGNGRVYGGAGTTYTKSKIAKYVGGCNSQPPAPLNSGLRCSSLTGCKADCIPNYQFPDGKTHISIICENGEWKVDDVNWKVVPSCQPICEPKCQNNGICVEPNQCSCPENFSGSLCEYENKPCFEYPKTPKNSRRQCRKKMCTISCLFGHEFPDGSSILQYECKNGVWIPTGEKWESIPDCQAICNPPCQNGGKCLAFNICQCPQDFRGPQCQYSTTDCSPKKLAFNGGYNCSGDMNSFRCSLSCPDGISFEYTPEAVYTCQYSTGQFMPDTMPQCVFPSNVEVIPGKETNSEEFLHEFYAGHGYKQGVLTTHPPIIVDNDFNEPEFDNHVIYNHQTSTVNVLPKKGVCYTWNGNHYKTFDGKVYSFESKCAHVLLRDSQDDTFSVIVQNSPSCFESQPDQKYSCFKEVKIYLDEKVYELKTNDLGVPIFVSNNKVVPVPAQLAGIRVSMVPPNFLVVSLDIVGVKIRWDGNQLVSVEAKENLWKRTEGLCGIMDGSTKNDIMTKEGTIPHNIISMAVSWGVQGLGYECRDTPTEEHACLRPISGSNIEASSYCKKILKDSRFATCLSAVDITVLLDACKWDYCSCRKTDPTLCICETVEVLVKECKEMGIPFNRPWRDQNICPMHCTGGKVYKHCGPVMGQQMCGSTVLLPEEDGVCVEGCYCPEGTILHKGRCITKDQCPCKQRGKMFPAGSTIKKDCNTCNCVKGEWICTEVSCGARCAAVGDPHYVTFDGKTFDFMGHCSYYLVKTQTFSIEAENVACAGAISQTMNFPNSLATGLPSCTRTVTIRTHGQIVKLQQNHNVVIYGLDYVKLPYSSKGVSIRMASSIFLKVTLDNGVEVWWDGATRVYVDLPGNFREETRGLCGTFNNNQKDDFLTPEDDIEPSVVPFANKWKTIETCENMHSSMVVSHPCDVHIYNKAKAEQYCSKITSDIFRDCHSFVNPEQYYRDCLYDMCACQYKVSQCLCPTISAYGTECSRKGVNIEWRSIVRECGVQCFGNQKYQGCGNSCARSCSDIALNTNCKPQCVEGCNCPPGEALDEDGECVPIGRCKCENHGMKYPPGYKEVRYGPEGKEICTCTHAMWQCKSAHGENAIYPNETARVPCDASKNFEFAACEDLEPVTCKNMHHRQHFSPAICHPGCNCKEGYVLDTANRNCVKPVECPCHHGGKSYKEQSAVQNDCNTCICENGRWKCGNRQCTAECSTWGDSHFKTFDGRYYDFQGQCDYILSKGTLDHYSFDVTIRVVPCGSLGTSCAKSVTVRVSVSDYFEAVTLTHDKPIPLFTNKKYLIVRQKELLVIVEAPDLGLKVQWDKGTRVYVKLSPEWKNAVRGLCGNYNDNARDDFTTPSGGPPEVLPAVFGDSWKLQPYCPEATELVDTCAERPNRRVWALKMCGVLKTSIFAACHVEVPIDEYFNRCVFDTCACDEGGDCECLCTSLAAYAQECNNRGVPVKWRSQNLCPIQCDEECFTYSPCMSTCPHETCDNLLSNVRLELCEKDSCIEGCSPKPCPLDHVYSNSSYKSCVPKSRCKPVCMEIGGIVYYEGDLIEKDDCHTCHCSRNQKMCIGQPCSETESLPDVSSTSPSPKTQQVQCKSGFTQWINQDQFKPFQIKRYDIEPLPNSVTMNKLEGAKCDRADMAAVQCRTVGTHINFKETGHDVECSLEKGLICKSNNDENPCPDFEIRFLCECSHSQPCDMGELKEHPTDCHKYLQCNGSTFTENNCKQHLMFNPLTMICEQPEEVIKIQPDCLIAISSALPPSYPSSTEICPYKMVYSECAIDCKRLCTDYLYDLRENGQCLEGISCEPGCVPFDKTSCPIGHLYADKNLCVPVQDCMCSDDTRTHLKPGDVTTDECFKCQCVDNFIECFEFCTSTIKETDFVYQNESELEIERIENTYSVTPPPLCAKEDLINLIQGDEPLPDEFFHASSSLNEAFGPENARLDNKNLSSGGSWVPRVQDHHQYIEIDFPRQEPVYGIIVKGSSLFDEYVTSYKVSYTHDKSDHFVYLLDEYKKPRIFRGSFNPRESAVQMFNEPFEARKVRIHPNTWHNQISLRLEILGCEKNEATTTSLLSLIASSQKPEEKPELCDDEMGLRNFKLLDEQIQVSSEISRQHGKDKIRLNSNEGWTPFTNSPNEWVVFDLTGPRIITGIVTKGGARGWITAYKVYYSPNGREWNPVMEENMRREKVFIGNYDNNSPQVNNFAIPIQAKYIKIVPVKWHKTIGLRVELRGCFEEYDLSNLDIAPLYVSTTAQPEPTILPCNLCPGLEESLAEDDVCRCPVEFWFDGSKCVNRTECPCIVNGRSYQIGAYYELEDCSACICKIGGMGHCGPKSCPVCGYGEKPTVTSTCACTCQECPVGTVLCPTSNICIDSERWCDGIADCPDDEIMCLTSTESTFSILDATAGLSDGTSLDASVRPCPEIHCPPGFEKILKKPSQNQRYHSYLSPAFSYGGTISGGQNRKETFASKSKLFYATRNRTRIIHIQKISKYSKSGFAKSKNTDGLGKYPDLPEVQIPKAKPTVSERKICPDWRCVRLPPTLGDNDECPPVECPPDHIPTHDPNQDLRAKECPRYICEPTPNDFICTISGNSFQTFDKTEFKYDICYHIIGRDFVNSDWLVALKKNCDKQHCTKTVVIKHDDDDFILGPNMQVEFNGFKYNPNDLSDVSEAFSVYRIGDTVTFNSNKFGFWVVIDKNEGIKLGAVNELKEKVDGLCGYFSGYSKDDKRKPGGDSARTTEEFGDSWALVHDQPEWCATPTCSSVMHDKAAQICNTVREPPLSACGESITIDAFVSKCIETVCNCLGTANDRKSEDQCRCKALQNFAVQCLTVDNDVDIAEWRMYHNCPALCPPPLVYHDCFQRRCEPTCESVSDPYACPKINSMCFAGCYCPPGFVRKEDTCVEVSDCKDCECNILPNQEYVTYDSNSFTVNGNCVYVMSRDVADSLGQHNFQVLITNAPCTHNPSQNCVRKVTILYRGHKIHVYLGSMRLKFSIDKEVLYDFDDLPEWLLVTEAPLRHLTFVLAEAQLEVTVQYPTLATAVKAPSQRYGGKLEGLCGDCNGDKNNDIRRPGGGQPINIDDFTLSWLYENLPGQSRDVCESKKALDIQCSESKEEICDILFDVNIFGQCSNVLSPDFTYDWCKNVSCHSNPCGVIENYANECAARGFCIQWHDKRCPAPKCPEGQSYVTCSPVQQSTCNDVIAKKSSVPMGIPIRGCFCPPGLVLLDNSTCVPPEQCMVCDEEGHYSGQEWKKDKCTTCKCEQTSVQCNTEVCPSIDTICNMDQTPVKLELPEAEHQCCDKYFCKAIKSLGLSTMSPATCQPPQPLICGEDQVLRVKFDQVGCEQLICECKPREQCKSLDEMKIDPLDPGFVNVMDNSGCCPKFKLVCMDEKCPPPPPCPATHNLKHRHVEGKCCPVPYCEPPKDMCIFEPTRTAAEIGGDRPLTENEEEITLKSPNEEWQDGPCRSCKCVASADDTYQPVCSFETCPPIDTHVDFENYELKVIRVYNQCCPKIKRVACKHSGSMYQVGESWKETIDPCTTMECIQGDSGVQKKVTVKACDKICSPGHVYQEPDALSIDKCCGKCEQIACVMNNAVYELGEKWTLDNCTHYECIGGNGSVHIETIHQTCKPPPEDTQDFAYDIIQEQCCKVYKVSACRDGVKVYQVGQSWQALHDKCTKYTCVQKDGNRLDKQVSVQECQTECPLGWEYQQSPATCCGVCVQVACIAGGMMKQPGETWKSLDGCTTYSCDDMDGELVVSAAEAKCPLLLCEKSEQFKDGCCMACRSTGAEGLVLESKCKPVPKPVDQTVGLIRVNRMPDGKCLNTKPIEGFMECYGACVSQTIYNSERNVYDSDCTCCQASSYQSVEVELDCENGRKWKKSVAVPTKCNCLPCNDQKPETVSKRPEYRKLIMNPSTNQPKESASESAIQKEKIKLPKFPEHRRTTTPVSQSGEELTFPESRVTKTKTQIKHRKLTTIAAKGAHRQKLDREFEELLGAFGHEKDGNGNNKNEQMGKRESGEIDQLIEMLEKERKAVNDNENGFQDNDQEFEQQLESFR